MIKKEEIKEVVRVETSYTCDILRRRVERDDVAMIIDDHFVVSREAFNDLPPVVQNDMSLLRCLVRADTYNPIDPSELANGYFAFEYAMPPLKEGERQHYAVHFLSTLHTIEQALDYLAYRVRRNSVLVILHNGVIVKRCRPKVSFENVPLEVTLESESTPTQE